MADLSSPIELTFTPAGSDRKKDSVSLRTVSSYSFDRNIMVPASPFRFTAEGIDKDLRTGIRSGDTAELFLKNVDGLSIQIATGFIDETDTHVTSSMVSYVLTGRDTIGQLVDNAAIDSSNKIIHLADISLQDIAERLRQGTRIPTGTIAQQIPGGKLLFQTNPGETKINALQRYMEYTNCLVWSHADGRMIVGKPDMAQPAAGKLTVRKTDPRGNNVLECRVRRNVNMAIRKVAVQLQALSITDPSAVTFENADDDVSSLSDYFVGKSVYRMFSQGNGTESVNSLRSTGGGYSPQQIPSVLAKRELAMSNVHVLDVEAVVRGHVNENGIPYNIDQVYSTVIEDDDVEEDLYVYGCRYDMTKDKGRTTTLRLCKLGTIVADVSVR